MSANLVKILITLIVSTTILFLGFEVANQLGSQENPTNSAQTKPNVDSTLNVITNFHRDLYANVSKAIVAIKSKATRKNNATGTGTGCVIDADGHILTAIENVDINETDVEITFVSGLIGKANYVGSDILNACALLKLSEKQTTPKFLEFGDSKAQKLGDAVFVISNAFNDFIKTNTPTMSKGEITGFYRSSQLDLETIKWTKRFNSSYNGALIEVSCAVNNASFGAPLLNSSGKIIGIVSKSANINRWLGTAIPAHQILANFANLKTNKKNPGSRIHFKIDSIAEGDDKGRVKISEILDSTKYQNLKIGDIILKIDCDELINGKEQFDKIMKNLPLDSRVYFTLKRKNKKIRVVEYLK